MKLQLSILLAVFAVFAVNAWACDVDTPQPQPQLQPQPQPKSERPNFETPPEQPIKSSRPKSREERALKAIAYHVKNLRDPDPDVQLSSCEMLGVLMRREAIGPLIEVLNLDRKSDKKVILAAHQALLKLTDQKFARDDYAAWNDWWKKVPEDEQHGSVPQTTLDPIRDN